MGLKRYRYRAYPTAGQERNLSRLFGSVRVVFNDVIASRRAAHAAGSPFESSSQLQKRLITEAKLTQERAWLSGVSNTPLQQAARDADMGYRNFFNSLAGRRKGKRVGAPRFRSRRDNRQAARFTRNSGFGVLQTTHGVGKVRLPKIGWVRFTLSRELPSAPSSVTVIREADGTYFVSFVVDVPTPRGALPQHLGRKAGIDLGLTDFAAVVYSDGTREKVANPRFARSAARRLARAQRSLSRKVKGSSNRAKQRAIVARLHRQVANQRLDHAHQVAARLIRENQAITVETLSITGMARTRLAKSIHDVGWGQFLNILEEKATAHGRDFAKVDRFLPSSQVCAVCATLDGPKPLKIRVWECGCGAVLDRDYNAAVNIMLAGGHPESQNAYGPELRLQLAGALGDEAGTRRNDRPSIPRAA